jgi:sugar-specific transcriptional regulator TrmB
MQIRNPEMIQKLEKAGFNNKEALVYVSLLELGGAYPSRVAEYCGLKRSTVYSVLVTLSIRGIINEIEKRNKLFYQIEKPQKLVRYSESRIRMAEESLDMIKGILPNIENLYGTLDDRPKITYYEKEEGILQIYEDHISVNKPYEMVAWANANELINLLPEQFFDRYVKTKEKIGIVTRGILPDTEENRKFNNVRYGNMNEKVVPKLRYVSSEYFPSTRLGEITMYGENKVSIVNFEKNKMIGTIIEDMSIHQMMKMIFELSWESRLLRE